MLIVLMLNSVASTVFCANKETTSIGKENLEVACALFENLRMSMQINFLAFLTNIIKGSEVNNFTLLSDEIEISKIIGVDSSDANSKEASESGKKYSPAFIRDLCGVYIKFWLFTAAQQFTSDERSALEKLPKDNEIYDVRKK